MLISLAPLFDKADLAKFVLVLMYLKGPVGQIVLSLPMFSLALVSFRNVAELSEKFSSPEPDLISHHAIGEPALTDRLTLQGVRYTFSQVGDLEPFSLGPIDFEIHKGETVFITGENGSGKTTLIKLILGLYEPSEGEIRYDGELITNSNRDDYRQNFSAIFFDFFLFEQLIESDPATEAEICRYLERLDIAHKVSVYAGCFTTVDLSAGQRKRLALVETFTEKRPIVVLDEWAAEQDPTFRRIFYREIVPEMKRRGQTLIVVSHDDRYFDAADRLIHIEGGRIA